MSEAQRNEAPLDRIVMPIPGGIGLTLQDRCDLIDWRDRCVAEAESRAIAVERDRCASILDRDAKSRPVGNVRATLSMLARLIRSGA